MTDNEWTVPDPASAAPPQRQGPPVPPPAAPPSWGPPAPAAVGTNGLAVASLVLGILWVYWIGSVLALIFGYAAKNQIRRTGEAGSGLATAGIVLGWVGVGILAIVIIAIAVAAGGDSGY